MSEQLGIISKLTDAPKNKKQRKDEILRLLWPPDEKNFLGIS
jgi:hypothetical protein